MKTNAVEICCIRSLEWKCFEAAGSDTDATTSAVSSVYSALTTQGYMCSLRSGCPDDSAEASDGEAPVQLWVFDLNKRDKIPVDLESLQESFSGRWIPDSGTPIDCEALAQFQKALDGLVMTVMPQNTFTWINGEYVLNVQDEDSFYCSTSANTLDCTHSSAISVSFEFFINGDHLGVYCISHRFFFEQSTDCRNPPGRNRDAEVGFYEHNECEPNTENVVRSCLSSLFNLNRRSGKGSSPLLWDYDNAIVGLLAVGSTTSLANRGKLASSGSDPMKATQINGSAFARKRPRSDTDDVNPARLSSQGDTTVKVEVGPGSLTNGLSPVSMNPHDAPSEEFGNMTSLKEFDFSGRKKVPEPLPNPLLVQLEEQASLGLEVQKEDPDRYKRDRFAFPPEYLASAPGVHCQELSCSFIEYLAMRSLEKSLKCDYMPDRASGICKCSSADREKILLIANSEEKPKVEYSSIADEHSNRFSAEPTLTKSETRWASILLRQQALVPWSFPVERCRRRRETHVSRIAERKKALSRVLPIFESIRKWLMRSSDDSGTSGAAMDVLLPIERWCTGVSEEELSGEEEHPGISFMTLKIPQLVTSFGETWLKVPPTAMLMWESSQLRPYSDYKMLDYVILCPQTSTGYIAELACGYIQDVVAMYQLCGLGNHSSISLESIDGVNVYRGSKEHDQHKCIALVPRGPAGETVASYEQICRRVRSLLLDRQADSTFSERATSSVVYVIDPFTSPNNVDRSRLLAALGRGVWGSTTGSGDGEKENGVPPPGEDTSVVFELISIQQLLRFEKMAATLREVAFSVFNKTTVTRQLEVAPRSKSKNSPKNASKLSARVFEPLFALSEHPAEAKHVNTDSFGFANMLKGDVVDLDPSSDVLHGAYMWTSDFEWLVSVWTNSRGDVVRIRTIDVDNATGIAKEMASTTGDACKSVGTVLKQLWEIGLEMTSLMGQVPHFILCRVGTITLPEFVEWGNVFGDKFRDKARSLQTVSLCSVVINPSVQLVPNAAGNSVRIGNNTFSWGDSIGGILSAVRSTLKTPAPLQAPLASGYLVLTPEEPVALGRAGPGNMVDELSALEQSHELTLEVALQLQYNVASGSSSSLGSKFVKRDSGSWTEKFLSAILIQFHDLSFLTVNPITTKRRSLYPTHIATARWLQSKLESTIANH